MVEEQAVKHPGGRPSNASLGLPLRLDKRAVYLVKGQIDELRKLVAEITGEPIHRVSDSLAIYWAVCDAMQAEREGKP